EIRHGNLAALEERTLIGGRKESVIEAVHAAGRDHVAVQHDEAGQVAALAAQAVRDPRSHARPALLAVPSMDEEIGIGMLGEVRGHGANDAEVVRTGCDIRKQLTYGQAALSVLFELPRRLQ